MIWLSSTEESKAQGRSSSRERHAQSGQRPGRSRDRGGWTLNKSSLIIDLSGFDNLFNTIDLIRLIRRCAGLGLAESKALTEMVLAGGTVTISFDNDAMAQTFRDEVAATGVHFRWRNER